MATFGYTTQGSKSASPNYGAAGVLTGFPYTASTGDVVTKISIYTTQTSTYHVGIYTGAFTLVGTVQTISATANQWNDTGALSIALTNGLTYFVAADTNSNSNYKIAYNDGGTFDTTVSNAPLSTNITAAGFEARDYSIYATYTAGGGSSTSPSVSPSQSPSASVSPSVSPSQSPSASISPSQSPSASKSPSVSPSSSPSQSPSASVSSSVSPSSSPSQSPSASKSPSISPSVSSSESPSASLSPSVSPSVSQSQSPSASISSSLSPSISPSRPPTSASPSISSSTSPSISASASPSSSPSQSPSSSVSPSASVSPSVSPSASISGFQSKPLYYWDTTGWKNVDITG